MKRNNTELGPLHRKGRQLKISSQSMFSNEVSLSTEYKASYLNKKNLGFKRNIWNMVNND